MATGRGGLGFFPTIRIDKPLGRERHQLLQSEIRRSKEEKRGEKMVGMRQHGAWTKWESMVKRKITWSDLWRNEITIRFLIRSVHDILHSPTNLLIWKKSEIPLCQLCWKTGFLKRILSCCQTALADGRYRWHHDQILKDIAEAVAAAIHTNIPSNDRITIEFVKASVKAKSKKKLTPNALSSAADWEVRADLGKKVKIPGPYRSNSITVRYSYILKQNKENYNVGINSTLGGKCRGSPWTKEREIRRVNGVVQKQWMEGWLHANRSWI